MDRRQVAKGRGALSNPAGRFEKTPSVAVDDGWQRCQHWQSNDAPPDQDDFPTPDPRTVFLPDKTRNIIATNTSPDIPFEQSINPYKGCEHGCIYCYARPTHAYLDLSPGLDFETRIFFKTDPVERLQEALDKPGYRCRTLAMGTNTDPYQPGEAEHRITRRVLETLLAYRHPVSIVTKGTLILRDLDLLSELARHGLASVCISITTLDNALKTKLEPRTASPSARLRMVRRLADADVPVGVLAAPIIPFLNDHELESIIARSAEAGAGSVGYTVLRLPFEVEGLFADWLQEHYPDKAERILARVRDLHGGKMCGGGWGERMRGSGIYADVLAQRVAAAQRKHGLCKRRAALRTDLFRPRQARPQSHPQPGRPRLNRPKPVHPRQAALF